MTIRSLSALLLTTALAVSAPVADEPVAVVDGQPITSAAVDAQIRGELLALEQQAYDLRKQALDTLIYEQLLEKAAAVAGLANASEQMNAILEAKVVEPTDEEIGAFIAQNARIAADDPNASTQARNQLWSQRAREVQIAYLTELRAASTIEINIEPPRFEVPESDHSPSSGPADAPVTIVEFSDFECPYCSRAQNSMKQIREAYGDQVRFVFRNLPLSFHQNARKAASAAMCADEQDRFDELAGWMFDNFRGLGGDAVVNAAAELEIDVAALTECIDSGRYADAIDADLRVASSIGANSTPTFFVNGRMVKGAQRFETFKAIIDDELDRAATTDGNS